MKTITINLYSFKELSPEAQQKVLEKYYDINVYSEWWDDTYEDAKNIGLKIDECDIERGNFCRGSFMKDSIEVADNIMKEHGETCETYKTAKEYKENWDKLVEKYSDGINKDCVTEDNEYDFDNEANELEGEFLKALLEDYLIMLRKDLEYKTSKEAIIETIECNDYTFTEDGDMDNRK